jgi:hypothetical protein
MVLSKSSTNNWREKRGYPVEDVHFLFEPMFEEAWGKFNKAGDKEKTAEVLCVVQIVDEQWCVGGAVDELCEEFSLHALVRVGLLDWVNQMKTINETDPRSIKILITITDGDMIAVASSKSFNSADVMLVYCGI